MNIKTKAALKVLKVGALAIVGSVLVNVAFMYVPLNYLLSMLFVVIMGYLTRSLYLVYLSQFEAQERASKQESK